MLVRWPAVRALAEAGSRGNFRADVTGLAASCQAGKWFRRCYSSTGQGPRYGLPAEHNSINAVRSDFVEYFKGLGHTHVPSSPLIPHNDNSIMFTNAGMVQFKPYFLALAKAPYDCAVTSQKCVRAGGKHNDLENVGPSPRHHTLFEMLGNFSFGKYSRKEAITYAWVYLTERLGLPKDRLIVTVHTTDDASYEVWRNHIGLSADKVRKNDTEDNWWSMGSTGPCGPCTEIYWDLQNGKPDEDRLLELWNVVFMEQEQLSTGRRQLAVPCVDTGMGLERVTSVLQGKSSNYEVDTFQHLIGAVKTLQQAKAKDEPMLTKQGDKKAQYNIIADHLRSVSFLLADGVVPSNVGRGYVLRRILRRAAVAGWEIGLREPFLTSLYPSLLETFPPHVYPEIHTRAAAVCSLIENEETAFAAALGRGMKQLSALLPTITDGQLPADFVFLLYDSYGFPLDLSESIARSRGLAVDMDGVHQLLSRQKQQGLASRVVDGGSGPTAVIKGWQGDGVRPNFIGYHTHQCESTIVAAHTDPTTNDTYVSIDPCPFYGESGGQVGDKGRIVLADGSVAEVADATIPYEGGLVLKLANTPRPIKVGESVSAQIDQSSRSTTAKHHTATHLLHASLRKVLGEHVVQAGSVVEPGRLRFDFTYPKALGSDVISQVEQTVNEAILAAMPVSVETMDMHSAMEQGVMALFSEKYGSDVRVVKVGGFSAELCGGTHVDNVASLYPFKIVSESAKAAGIRRIEAKTGESAVAHYSAMESTLMKLAKSLKVAPDRLEKQVDQLAAGRKDLKKQVDSLVDYVAALPLDPSPQSLKLKEGVPLFVHRLDAKAPTGLAKAHSDWLAGSQPNAVHVVVGGLSVACARGSKVKDVHAGKLLQAIVSTQPGAKCGGSPTQAQGTLQAPLETIPAELCA